MSEVKVNKISPRSGTTVTLGDSGDTVSIPSGVTLANAGTVTGIPTSALSGTIATAQIADDAVTLAKMAPGTDGNVISYDASGNPVAVATGNAGQVLTSAGAGAPPTFADAGGGMTLLSATSVTNASSVTVNPPFSSTYSSYKIIIVGISPETTNQDLYFTFIKSDGSEETGANYRYTVGGFRESTTSTEGTGSASNCKWARNVHNDVGTVTGDILISNPQQSIRASVVGTSNKRFTNDAYSYAELFGCWMNPSTSYTQIKFFPGSGNWNAGGKIMVYGLKES